MQEFNRAPDTAQVSPQPYSSDSLGMVVTAANVLVSTVLIAAIYFDHHSATVAALSGVGYFALSTGLTVLALSGTLTHIVVNRQNQVTMRRYHLLQYYAPNAADIAPVQPQRTLPAQPIALSQHSTFVPAHAEPDDSAKREAAAWLLQLYAADGAPDPKKVLLTSDKERPGRVRIAAPSRPAKQYLLDKRIIHDLGNGFRLNLIRCSTITAAQNLLV